MHPSRHPTWVEALQRAHLPVRLLHRHKPTCLFLLLCNLDQIPAPNLLWFKLLELPQGFTAPGQPAYAVYYQYCFYSNRDAQAWTHRNRTESNPVKQIPLLFPVMDSQATLCHEVYLNHLKCQQATPVDSYVSSSPGS